MTKRRLISIRRRVRDVELEEYRREWAAVRKAVEALGDHAWAFASKRDRHERLEFLEFKGDDPRQHPSVAPVLAALDRDHPGRTEEWEGTD